jgi:excisionase family DNA binding protein
MRLDRGGNAARIVFADRGSPAHRLLTSKFPNFKPIREVRSANRTAPAVPESRIYKDSMAMDGRHSRQRSLDLSSAEITAAFSDPIDAERFPTILTPQQVAELLQVPLDTIYQWRSRGLLDTCSRKIGKHVRFFRDRLITLLFNKGLSNAG